MEMEKSPAERKKMVSNDISDDLAFSILSKLSVKSLNHFGCIQKSWSVLFTNPYFMSLFRKNFLGQNQSYYDDTSFLYLKKVTINSENKFMFYSLSGERFENIIKLDWPNPFQVDDPEFDVLGSGSINGILCLLSYSEPYNRILLWNPTTKEFKVVPTSHSESPPYVDVEITRHGFGYDSISDDYKVIRQVMYNPNDDIDNERENDNQSLEDVSYELFWEIYSLRSNSWIKLDSNVPHGYREDGICLDGVCHWLGEDGYDFDNYDEVYLLSFDLSNETTHIPSECDNRYFQIVWKDLVVLNGSIALISDCNKNDTFHISVWVNLA